MSALAFITFGYVEHICTAIVIFYTVAELYGCFMDWYTNS